ncbi:hypothetical protein RHMOL_Rhmol13G0175300 [Rhododendron molle]|uniref:Uncharacterized protein n=1 Tax=Rhododendron molle TaxID=49168 RepID=A0ACC0L8B5_RHOML|nr:hypothetical protein RHMOL_Rhmol13G0175300 [Rhododendron molle]
MNFCVITFNYHTTTTTTTSTTTTTTTTPPPTVLHHHSSTTTSSTTSPPPPPFHHFLHYHHHSSTTTSSTTPPPPPPLHHFLHYHHHHHDTTTTIYNTTTPPPPPPHHHHHHHSTTTTTPPPPPFLPPPPLHHHHFTTTTTTITTPPPPPLLPPSSPPLYHHRHSTTTIITTPPPPPLPRTTPPLPTLHHHSTTTTTTTTTTSPPPLFHHYHKVQVNSGNATVFWEHTWLGETSFKEEYPRLFSLSIQQEAKVSNMWGDVNGRCWELLFRRRPFGREKQEMENLKRRLQGVILNPTKPDLLQWRWAADRNFPVKSAYEQWEITSHSNNALLGSLWKSLSPPKVEIFVWMAIKEKVATRSLLLSRNLISEIQQALCPLCSEHCETNQHLFLHCRFSWVVWSVIMEWWNVKWVCPCTVLDLAT